MFSIKKPLRELMYDGVNLHLRINGNTRLLGMINTRLGALSKTDKLRAVASIGEWVKL